MTIQHLSVSTSRWLPKPKDAKLQLFNIGKPTKDQYSHTPTATLWNDDFWIFKFLRAGLLFYVCIPLTEITHT